jgi:phosphoribosylanthranilate isomerase
VKICGLTSIDDARAAISAGADLLGFNFLPLQSAIYRAASRSGIIKVNSVPKVRVNNPSPPMVGVFVDASIEDVTRITDEAGCDAIQLHGERRLSIAGGLKE